MVAAWGVGVFIGGLALLAVELAYPRRYLGILGVDLAVLGLLIMFVPEHVGMPVRIAIYLGGTILATLVAVPFYRRYAPHVGPMLAPALTAGDFGVVVESINTAREGLVRAGGILWTARADEALDPGTRVRILVIEADRLWVESALEPSADEGQRGKDGDDENHR